MLLVAERGREAELEAMFEQMGPARGGGRAKSPKTSAGGSRWGGKLVADIPAAALTDEAPVYDRPACEPSKAASTLAPLQARRRL